MKRGEKPFWDRMNSGRMYAMALLWKEVSAGTPHRLFEWLCGRAAGCRSLKLKITHDYLAGQMSVSRYSIGRAIKTLAQLNILRIDKEGIVGRDGDRMPTDLTLFPDELFPDIA